MTNYDPSILQKFVDKLYSQARSVVATTALFLAVIGGVAGYLYSASSFQIGDSYIIGGIVFGGLIGAAIGQQRAFKYKLEAQRLLCQMQIEKNTKDENKVS